MKKLIFCMIAGIMSLIGCGTPEPTGELLSVDYTHSGTMAGYIYEGRVKQDSNGNYVLTAMKENYGPLFQKQISKEAVDSFKQIIIEEKMYKYKEHYTPRMEVLDGEGWHFAAKFSDGTRIYSSGSNEDGISPQSSPTARAYTPPAPMHGLAAMVLAAFKDICKG